MKNMKNLKRLLSLGLVLAALLAFVSCGQSATVAPEKSPASSGGESTPAPAQKADVNLVLLSGSTGLGASKLIVDAKAGTTANNYKVEVVSDPTQVIAGLKQGKYDLAALPVNVAAKLYNMPDVEVQVVALNTLGVLYVLEKDGESIKSVADLKGKTIYTTGEGATPQYILEHILKKNGLTVGSDVQVVYRATADEVVSDISSVAGAVAMLPEPKATVVTKQMNTVRYALDMTAEWDKISDSRLTQGCVVALKSFVNENKTALDLFLAEYKASIEFVNKADEAAGNAVVAAEIIGKAPIAMAAIPKSNLVYIDGGEMKTVLGGTLAVLFEANAASVGGKLPDEAFYYQK
jgi:NitT/TauT family transport system substrate-binding protein